MKKKEQRKNVLPDIFLKFMRERDILNDVVIKYSGIEIKRFFNLDSQVYNDGKLPKKMKELIGLVCSLVLRCDDCIEYHIIKCWEEDISDEELSEGLTIGLVVGGSITIPHLRRAFMMWDKIKKGKNVMKNFEKRNSKKIN